MKPLIISISILLTLNSCNNNNNNRTEVSLNGTWELSWTDLTSKPPTLFEHQVQVPGLVDMAIPVIQGEDSALFENSTYWYRKTFTLDHSNRDKKLFIRAENEIISEQIIACEIKELGKKVYSTTITMPELTGEYQLVAEIFDKGVSVTSIRDFHIE